MRQDSGQMREESLVHSQRALGLDSSEQAIEGARVQVSGLVVHATHDGIWRVHHAADDET